MDQNELHVYSFEYEWEIATTTIRNVMDSYGTYDSPIFPSGSGQQWVVRVIRRGHSPYLQIIPQQNKFVCGKFTFSYNNAKFGCIFYSQKESSELSIAQIYNAIGCNNANSIVKIICKASVVVESSMGVSLDAQASKSLLKMSEDFETLYDSKQDSEITFCMKDKDIKAHKAILIARSEVFAAMFKNPLKESKSGEISITDTDDEVIEEMLRYMYTGKVPKLDSMTVELLECADTYQLDDLKENCLKSLQTHITIENAANTLILADRYRSEELKRHAIEYIIANVKGVTDTKAWKDMISTNGNLIEETFRAHALGIKPLNIPSSRSIMDENELHVYSFEYECKISTTSIRNDMYRYEPYKSPLFPSGSGQQWVVRVSRSNYNNPYLQIIPQQQKFVCGKFSFSYNDANLGCIYYYKNGTSDPKELSIEQIYDAIGYNNTSSIVKIICKASVVVESSNGVSLDAQASKSLLKMSEDFETLYDSKQDSDITFCVKDKDIKAHKAILIARSVVFAAMFKNKECQSGKTSITDTADEVIEEMLRYMYTGKVPKLDSMTVELLECADTYKMEDLKENCVKSLETRITIEKAANTLILADKYRSEELKRHAIRYIITNAEDVTETQAWKDMITTHGHLIEEAFRTSAIGSPVKKRKKN